MRKLINLFVIGTLLLLAACTSRPEADLMITNAQIITGTGEVIENGSVLIKGNRILSVKKEVGSAEGSTVIDANGKTVLPGLIDAHVHLLIENMSSMPQNNKELENFINNGLPDRLESYLETGITTVMSTGDFWPAIKDVRERIETGKLAGPRVFTSGPVFTAQGGHPAATVCGYLLEDGNNPWCREHIAIEVNDTIEARKAVDSLSRQGVDLIKMVYDDTSPPNVEQLKKDVMNEIIKAAHESGLRVYAHISEGQEAITAIEAGLDGLVHTPFRYTQLNNRKKLVKTIQSRNITTPTTSIVLDLLRERFANEGNEKVSHMFENDLSSLQQTIAQIAKANDSLVVLGTDVPQLPPDKAYHGEIKLASEAGLTPDQIIKAATRNAAIHLGRGNELGTLETGKLADLIIVDGNPLEDISELRNVELVVKDGEIVFGSAGSSSSSPDRAAAIDSVRTAQENRFHAMVDGDLEMLDHLLAENLTYTHSSGQLQNKRQLLDILASPEADYESIEPADVHVRILGRTAVLTGNVDMRVRFQGQVRNLQMRFLEVQEKQAGEWRLIAWQSTPLE